MGLFIGIDTSTTATKALLMSDEGLVVGTASSQYGFETPYPLWSEQNPELWWQATVEAIQDLLKTTGTAPEAVQAIGLTGQMHGLVLLDECGEVLRPAILWNDQRTASQCDEIRRRIGKDELVRLTGNDALTGFTAPKILWVQEEEPEIWAKARRILLPKDYVRYRLSGAFATDKAGAAGTLLFDLRERDWSEKLCDSLDIPRSYLPETFEGTSIAATLSREAAQITGLRAGLPLFAGAGDQAAAAVGTGAVRDGVISLSLGTSGVVFASSASPITDPEGRTHSFCHAVPGTWHMMGVILAAAGSLAWYRDTFAPDVEFPDLMAEAAEAPAGCDGLLFLPYLSGERTPHPDPLARGAFIGMTVRHQRCHMTRAVLEGVAFAMKDCFELMAAAGLSGTSQIRVTGGGANSSLWLQILADVLGHPVTPIATDEGAAHGAAILAAVGLGIWPDVAMACDNVVKLSTPSLPGPDQRVYPHLYSIYRRLYPALRQSFEELSHHSS